MSANTRLEEQLLLAGKVANQRSHWDPTPALPLLLVQGIF